MREDVLCSSGGGHSLDRGSSQGWLLALRTPRPPSGDSVQLRAEMMQRLATKHDIILVGSYTLSDIVDAVEIGLVVLVVEVLASSVYDLQWIHLGVVQAERRPARPDVGATGKINRQTENCVMKRPL